MASSTWGSPPGLWWSGWCGCTQTSASPRTRCYRPRECSSSSESFGYTFIWYGGLVIWIIWLYIHLIRGPHHLNHLVLHSYDTEPRHLNHLVIYSSDMGPRHLNHLVIHSSDTGPRHLNHLVLHSSDTEPRHLNHLVICTFIWYGASSSESFVYKFGYKFIWYGGLSFIHLIRRTFVLNNGHQSYKKNRFPFQTNSVMIIDKLRIPHAINLNNRNTWQLSS